MTSDKQDTTVTRSGINWTRTAAILVCVAFVLAALWLLGHYILIILVPFAAAWVLSCLLRPAAEWLSRHTRVPQKLCAAVLVVLLLTAVGWLSVQAGHRAIVELGNLIKWLAAEESGVSDAIRSAIERVMAWVERIPFVGQLQEMEELAGIWEQAQEIAMRMVREAALQLSGRLSTAAVSFVTSLPTILLSLLAFALSCYYFCADGDAMERGILSVCPESWRKKWPTLRQRGGQMARRYVRAYALLMLLTFVEMFIGFSILRVPYSFVLAVLVAVVDLLPVFGAGTILLPWAAGALVLGQYPLGSGLLILYGISLIVRQVAEPRLVGASLGLHPLASFAAMFAGFRLFGIVGLFLGPAVVLAIKGVLTLIKKRPDETAAEI